MATKTITELLQQANELKQKERDIKQQLKAQKQAIATEYIDNMDEATKQKQITEAQKILETAKQKAQSLKDNFKAQMKQIKKDVSLAKELLEWVNYKQGHSLPKVKNQYFVNANMMTFRRAGIKDISIDVTKTNWEKALKQELAKQGINGENRIADNIVYTAQQTVKAQQSIK